MADLREKLRAAFEIRLRRFPQRPDLQRRVAGAVALGVLTARETEVVGLVAEGLTNAQIADRLRLSRRTVHAHMRSIFAKLGVSHRSEAGRYALQHGLAPRPVSRPAPGALPSSESFTGV
jgi:DNA-binding NarL/FixJ family response regulator